jgi:Tfp pilus assembly protein PilN
MPNLGSVLSNVKDPWLLGAIAAGVVAIGGNAALYTVNTARLSRLDTVLAGVQSEKRRYDAVAAQKRQAERARDSLAAELTIIRTIDADRFIWPHLLDEITKALPQYTWVTQIQNLSSAPVATTTTGTTTGTATADAGASTDTRVSIDGRTVDIQAYTTFLRQLTASPWITDVTATRATTVIEQDRPVTEFNITLRYKRADSLYIRTVPLVESVR